MSYFHICMVKYVACGYLCYFVIIIIQTFNLLFLHIHCSRRRGQQVEMHVKKYILLKYYFGFAVEISLSMLLSILLPKQEISPNMWWE